MDGVDKLETKRTINEFNNSVDINTVVNKIVKLYENAAIKI